MWHFQNVHHDLWDFDNNAAPQLTKIKRDGKEIDVVAMAGKTGFLYVFDRVTGAPMWPIEERPVPEERNARRTELADAALSDEPAAVRPAVNDHWTTSTRTRCSPKRSAPPSRTRLSKARNMGLFTPIDFVDTVHIPGSNGGALFGYTAAEPTSGNVYVIGQDNPGVLKLLQPSQAAPGTFPGQAVYQRECQACHGPDRAGTDTGPTLLTVPGRVDPATIRAIVSGGKGRMPAFPHLNDVDMENLVSFVAAPAPGGGRGRGAGPAPSFPPGPVVASGGAQTRAAAGRGRGGARLPGRASNSGRNTSSTHMAPSASG